GGGPVQDQPHSTKTPRARLSCPSTTATTPSLPVDANDFFNSLLVLRSTELDHKITLSQSPASSPGLTRGSTSFFLMDGRAKPGHDGRRIEEVTCGSG